ncbi:MAG: hypothetical protein KIT87_22215 [Anaerolineae bacterium]|nr:hypothetical protein [Anaerolineae bacterium]
MPHRTMTHRPELLFVSPVLPAAGGGGRAMRAYAWLKRLARDYDVHVLVLDKRPAPETREMSDVWTNGPLASLRVLDVSAGGGPRLPGLVDALASLTPRAVFERVSPWVSVTPMLRAAMDDFLAGKRIERIVVFRLYLHEPASYAARCIGSAELEMDLDDIDSLTRLSVARALLRLGRVKKALVELLLAAHAAWGEQALLPK